VPKVSGFDWSICLIGQKNFGMIFKQSRLQIWIQECHSISSNDKITEEYKLITKKACCHGRSQNYIKYLNNGNRSFTQMDGWLGFSGILSTQTETD